MGLEFLFVCRRPKETFLTGNELFLDNSPFFGAALIQAHLSKCMVRALSHRARNQLPVRAPPNEKNTSPSIRSSSLSDRRKAKAAPCPSDSLSPQAGSVSYLSKTTEMGKNPNTNFQQPTCESLNHFLRTPNSSSQSASLAECRLSARSVSCPNSSRLSSLSISSPSPSLCSPVRLSESFRVQATLVGCQSSTPEDRKEPKCKPPAANLQVLLIFNTCIIQNIAMQRSMHRR